MTAAVTTSWFSSEHVCSHLIAPEDDYAGALSLARDYIAACRNTLIAQCSDAATEADAFVPLDGAALTDALLARLAHVAPVYLVRPVSLRVASWVLAQYAPQGVLCGCVLQNFTNASNGHETVPATVHRIHSWQVGDGLIGHNHGLLYRRLLEAAGVQWPALSSSRAIGNIEVLPSAWDLPAYRLSLSLFPDAHRYEILGAMLFEIAMGSSAVADVASADVAIGSAAFFAATSAAARQPFIALARAALADALDASAQPHADATRRVAEGFLISLALHEAWTTGLRERIAREDAEPHAAMVRLVERKGKFAVGYHSRLKLGARPFDDAVVADAESFVRDLARSRWISPGRPAQSLLLSKLTAFGGPMFRVFSDSELEVIREWIISVGQANDVVAASIERRPPHVACPAHTSVPALPASGQTRPGRQSSAALCTRELYVQLLNLEHHPEARDHALRFARNWLARCERDLPDEQASLALDRYSAQNLRQWFEQKALDQARSYSGDTSANIEKSRDDVIREALQLCPMIFIDGAWLQRWSNAGLVDTEIGASLYKILSDEIGNGSTELNHPNIYRALMAQMGEALPDFRSREFAYLDRFDDASFATPAFWLSLSQFPRRFMPETLGLNLAMELSGVGGAYRTARDELRHYGFSTLFVDLHNTIDNVSTGHSAMAVDAIEIYMDRLDRLNDDALVARHWRRMWVGYSALAQPPQRWRDRFRAPRYLLTSFGQSNSPS